MNAIIKEWLLAAKLDLDSIPYLLKDESLTPVVAFHCQQAVEKSLKSDGVAKSPSTCVVAYAQDFDIQHLCLHP